ncbi:MAG TPA: hypothetical protein VK470_00185 [Bacteroidota bacterium]|nr:hypothetical protein [Bacteroidota bacterium]
MNNDIPAKKGNDETQRGETDRMVVREEWLAGILESIDVLEELNKKTEDGFLSVGSELQNIHGRSTEISHNLAQVMDTYTSQGQGQCTTTLDEITETSERFLGNFETTSSYAVEHLCAVMKIMESLPGTLREFDRLVSQLRIMGITTRIETERLGLINMGFEHLADEVTTLGENISKKAKEVQVSIKTIFGIVKMNEQNLVRLRSTQKGLQLTVARTMNEDLRLLREKHDVFVKEVANISSQSGNSLQSINTIVGALQFHDITRQQIEHVIDALKDLHARLTSGEEDDALPYLIIVCELQPAQLRCARVEFMNAVLAVVSSFGSLSDTIAQMQTESREAIGCAGSDNPTFFSLIGANLQQVTQALIEGERGLHEFLDSLEQIETVVSNMRTFMEQMSEAGDEVELLALNSRVRAAKTRERGAALGVIAESIQRISTMAEIHIAEVVQSIGGLVRKTEEMRELARNSEISRDTESLIDTMTENLRTLISEFSSSSALGKSMLEQTAQSSSVLRKDLDAMAASVRDTRAVCETVERIERLLGTISQEARAVAPAFVISEVDRRLVEMKERYTMHAERNTHAAYISGDTTAEGRSVDGAGSVELF